MERKDFDSIKEKGLTGKVSDLFLLIPLIPLILSKSVTCPGLDPEIGLCGPENAFHQIGNFLILKIWNV